MACSALIESGKWSRDAIERQMSHQERNNVRAAYIHKAELIPERMKMMQWWSDYLEKSAMNFIIRILLKITNNLFITRGSHGKIIII